jgi:hypothetical protein
MPKRFKVVNQNSNYFGKIGLLVYECEHDLCLSIDDQEKLIFDKSEVEEV